MYSEYQTFYSDYTAKYGPKTAIFMAVGSFYELYTSQDVETGECTNNTRDLADLLGLQVSIREGEAAGRQAGVAGFPDYALHKWAARLTATGWTVVVVDQIKSAAGKVLRREVNRILSPSTHVEAMSAVETPFLTSILFEERAAAPPLYGVATLDLSTGTTVTYGGTACGRQDVWTVDDLSQFIAVHAPKEVICHWRGDAGSIGAANANASTIRRILSLPPTVPLHIKTNASEAVKAPADFSKPAAREDYLRRTYTIRSMLPPRDFLGLRSPQEELALLYLLQFTETHAPSALTRFHRNNPWTPQLQLICGNHAISQLQMDVVAGLFGACLTPFGKRDIRQRLLKPLAAAAEIERRLSEVAAVIAWPDETRRQAEKQLRFMFDLPRLHRKVLTATVTAAEFSPLAQTYEAIGKLLVGLAGSELAAPTSAGSWQAYIAVFTKYINAAKATTAGDDSTPYVASTFPAVAATESAIAATLAEFETWRQGLAATAGLAADSFRLEAREKEPFGVRGSTAQLKALAAAKPKGITIKELKSGGWVESPQLDALNTKLIKLREQLAAAGRAALLTTCQALSEAGAEIWSLIEEWVSHVDCTQCVARVSKERGYSRPVIEAGAEAAGVEIRGMRHPLVEDGRVAYVQHDVGLGLTDGTADASASGYLVYGMNASGKSTLMKAVGLAVLLAQAGCYVPAKSMRLAPFKAVYTRILNQDNIFAGLSSFAVEMSELRDILRAADRWSLVLGDELCAGTESVSAQALVASGIQWLAERGAKYIFATHLHELPELLDPAALALQIWHLHVEYDAASGKLIYDRSLRPGSGSTLYGLEVAKALDLPFEFLEAAHANRRKIIGTRAEADAVGSAWNAAVVVKRCEMCGREGARAQLEVHHIDPRASADPTGILPDGTPMNAASNLAVLCQRCHDEHHAGRLHVGKVQQTSEGPSRAGMAASLSTAAAAKSKWSDDEVATIKSLLGKLKTASLKTIKYQLEKDHGIEISESSLRAYKAKM